MIARLLGTALALALLASCTFDLDYDRYAIVYGVAAYPIISDLTYTDDDAWDMQALLEAQGFQVTTRVTDDAVVSPLVPPNIDEASYDQLYRDFASVAAQADLDDLFVFYFSGHGGPGATAGTEDVPGSDVFDEAVVLVNESLDDEMYLWDDELAELLRTIPCARKIVIIDACYVGGFIGNQLEADAIPTDFSDGSKGFFGIVGTALSLYANFEDYGSDITPADALVIAAAGEREEAYEDPSYENGVMTHFLLESATSGDANRDQYVTVSEAFRYIYRGINREFNPAAYLNGKDVFFPHGSGGAVDYVLFKK
jgi:hypothetical protein